jgi:hypothetical protein
MVNNPECDNCKQATETASHVVCDYEDLATLRFKHVGPHFMEEGDFKEISVSRILHFVQSVRLLHA